MVRISTLERWRSRLPHWEVEGCWHFVTIRCTGSLPVAVKQRLTEIHQALKTIEPQCDSFRQLQRQYFLSMEKYLDTGAGFAPFKSKSACAAGLEALATMNQEGWRVGEATLMPNHVHLLIRSEASPHSLKEILKRFKGRSSRQVNDALGRSGKFWQQDWFDRWMRHEAERRKVVDYIRANPVKAKLCAEWADYPWRISHDMDSQH